MKLSKLFSWSDAELKRVTLSLIPPVADWTGHRTLDCGPGNCQFTKRLFEHLPFTAMAVADSNINRLNIARANGWLAQHTDFDGGPQWTLIDTSSQPWATRCQPLEAYDVIHAGQIIEHLSNTDGFIRGIHRALRPGGYVLISTPNLAAWHNIAQLVIGRQPHVAMVSDEIVRWKLDDDEHGEPKHRRIFTASGLGMLLDHHGFKVEAIEGAGYYPLFGPPAHLMQGIDRNHAAYIVARARKIS